ncbi:MAG TPA: sulfotransferase [Ensifer sp.]|nr:sulfotransferase [Ensifer sp.]
MMSHGPFVDIDFLHIGDYKTGTTWLQRDVFGRDPRINLVGEGSGEAEATLWALLESLSLSNDLDMDVWKGLFESQLSQDSRLRGISRESLISPDFVYLDHWQRTADRMREAFGSTKVIVTFRHQQSMLGSIYSTYLKNGGTKQPEDLFLACDAAHRVKERFDYFAIASYYASLFGRERCLFLSYNDLAANPSRFLERLYNFIGIRPPADLGYSSRQNISYGQGPAAIQRILNKAVRSTYNQSQRRPMLEPIIGAGIRTVSSRREHPLEVYRKHLLGDALEQGGHQYPIQNYQYLRTIRLVLEKLNFPPKLSINPSIWAEFRDCAETTNAKLENEFGVKLQ